MSGWSFHPTLVEPFYASFMNGNILCCSTKEQKRVLADFYRRLPEYSNVMLREMLFESWRSQKVAAWVIAQRRQNIFLSYVIELLLRPTAYPEHLCICLARLGGDLATDALSQYLKLCSETPAAFEYETQQVDVAFAALCWLKPEMIEEHSEALDRYYESIDSRCPHWQTGHRLKSDLPEAQRRFLAMMALFDHNL